NAHKWVSRIESAAMAAADLTRQMLAYSGRGHFLVEAVDLPALLTDISGILETSIARRGNLVLQLEAVPLVDADASQLRQLALNLLTNASEALGDAPGRIMITTALVNADAPLLESFNSDATLSPGQYVSMEVSDTGIGMDAETRTRMFDPFFTTKETGHGLGLAATLGIVRGHGGAIRVDSEPGHGTTVTVLLPVSESERSAAISAAKQSTIARGGTVLVIDDEPAVLEFASEALQLSGITTRLALDGIEGLAIFREDPRAIDMVLLDMTMPRMSGDEVFQELLRIDPDVRVVLSSGYNEQEMTTRFAGEGLAGFLQKPYTLTELNELLEKLWGTSN
ncbi:MAG: two-component system cell cycle sensor histidine kinase/response regulator CckA, partial [Myxococcota bacterium]